MLERKVLETSRSAAVILKKSGVTPRSDRMENITYHKLLDSAQGMIQSNGFNAFSYRDLSTLVGITTASIHYHFPTKADMGEALTRRYRESFNEVLRRIEADNRDAPTRIEQYVKQFLQTLEHGGKICLCGMLASDYQTLPENVRKEIRAFFTENEAWLEMVLQQGKTDGSFVFDSEAKDLAIAFFAMIEGAMLGARMFEDKSRLQRTVDCWRSSVFSQGKKG